MKKMLQRITSNSLFVLGGESVKVKKIPMRMCNGCMEMKPKKELIRVVKTNEEEVLVDLTGKNLVEALMFVRAQSVQKKLLKQKG